MVFDDETTNDPAPPTEGGESTDTPSEGGTDAGASEGGSATE